MTATEIADEEPCALCELPRRVALYFSVGDGGYSPLKRYNAAPRPPAFDDELGPGINGGFCLEAKMGRRDEVGAYYRTWGA